MNENKTYEHASEVIKAMQEEYVKGVIKDYEMNPLVNMKTGEMIGFAVVLQVSAKYDYSENLLNEWKDRFEADGYQVSVKRNQLWLTFKIRGLEPSVKHIAKMSHAIGLDNKQPDKDGVYNAYRNGSFYNESDNLWDELVISGFAKTKRAKDDYRHAVTPKGFQFLAEHHKIMIRYENEYEGRADR